MSIVEVLWIMTKNVTVFSYLIKHRQAKMQDVFEFHNLIWNGETTNWADFQNVTTS